MDERSALLAGILREPACDTRRLVFADWLEENGEGEQAEFIRVQCGRLADLTDDALFRREGQLADAAERWMLPLANFEFGVWSGVLGDITFGAEGGTVCTFRRGFVVSVQMWAADFLQHAEAIFRQHPVTSVCLVDKEPEGNSWIWVYQVGDRGTDALLPAHLHRSIYYAMRPFAQGYVRLDENVRAHTFRSRERAHSALSRGCVAYARRLAGLPPLTAPNSASSVSAASPSASAR